MPSDGSPHSSVLGFGSIGRRHAGLAPSGAQRCGLRPRGITDATPGMEVCESADEALEAGGAAYSLADQSTPRSDQRAVEHGCHVLVEKPLAVRAEPEAQHCSSCGRGTGAAYSRGHEPALPPRPASPFTGAAAGPIGTPLTGHFTFGSYLPELAAGLDYRQSYSARSELGGGVLLDVIHEVDYAQWVLGAVNPCRARGPRLGPRAGCRGHGLVAAAVRPERRGRVGGSGLPGPLVPARMPGGRVGGTRWSGAGRDEQVVTFGARRAARRAAGPADVGSQLRRADGRVPGRGAAAPTRRWRARAWSPAPRRCAVLERRGRRPRASAAEGRRVEVPPA